MPRSKKDARQLSAAEVMNEIFTPRIAKKIKKLVKPKARRTKKK